MTEWSPSGNSSFSHRNWWLRYNSTSHQEVPLHVWVHTSHQLKYSSWANTVAASRAGEVEVFLPRKLLRLRQE